MAQDAPADTAGPSSPPPRLPEGWLPQWEGVQRKWYFVQRATGKSQWEIPTEPVVLTPSTTPTSIGTGPSQAPLSRPSTNSPRMTGSGTTLAERIESTANSAKYSSSLDAQVNEQSENLPHEHSGMSGHYSNQTDQRLAHHYGQYVASTQGGYEPEPLNQRSIDIGNGSTLFHPANAYPAHAMGQQALTQDLFRPHWGNSTEMTQGHQSGIGVGMNKAPFQPFTSDPYRHNSSAYQPSGTLREGHIPSPGGGFPPSQPQWQLNQQPPFPHAPHQSIAPNFGTADLSQSFYGSCLTPQTTAQSPGDFASRSSLSSNPSLRGGDFGASRDNLQATQDPFLSNSRIGMDHTQSILGSPMSRSHLQQSTTFQQSRGPGPVGYFPPYGYSSQSPIVQGQRHSTTMARTHSGTTYNSIASPTSLENHGRAHDYQNTPMQAGAQQYLPHQPDNTSGTSGPLGVSQGQSTIPDLRQSRIAASDPQFISGPWASSTPPTSTPQAPT
ncbi:uncharacterized protein N7459_004488 [Penicillium hispanicum]|uniref:uncharacterized protein n=1 Tax=Penicillium hispanicum TaxID=1080232 RepID=UPI0025406BEB|nr:uncharacterized protein N7459_004488 [Penicillium hispanicum]KAJ5584688.1 hypothetical protein N7459_004488 [Penicillium hispanicum]